MKTKQHKVRCKALTKAGKPCRAAATAGGLCYFHANPNKAAELGRIGGKKKRSPLAENPETLPTLDNATAVRDVAGRLFADVHSGKLNPRVAAGLVPLLNLQLRAIEAVNAQDLENLKQRLAALEEALGEGGPTEIVGRSQASPVLTSSEPEPPEQQQAARHMA
jgi:hypothetical protein